MIIRTLLLGGLAAGLTLAVGCKKKDDKAKAGDAAAAGAATGAAGAEAAGAGAAGGTAVATAAGEGVGDLPAIADCPKSLAGQEKVARVIKKECGPVVVTDNYTVDGTLTLEAGAVLKFKPGAKLDVGYYGPARLVVKGTKEAPVTFTSAGDAAAGEWSGVRLYEGAKRSSLEGLVLEWAGDADKGALYVDAEDVTLTGSTIRGAKEIGVRGGDKATFAAFTGNTFDKPGKVAVSVEPKTVGTMGEGNTFPPDAYIEIRGGTVDHDAKWVLVGAPFNVTDDVHVDGKEGRRATLEIVAGSELRFVGDASLTIGYYQSAGLKVSGTKEKPVGFRGVDKKPDGWTGLAIHDSGEGTITGAIFESGGADDDHGALAVNHGSLTVKDTRFVGNQLALSVSQDAKKFVGTGLAFEGNGKAALVYAENAEGLGEGNTYADKQTIEIRGGTVGKDATWALQPGAIVQVTEDIHVDKATLRIAAGAQLAFKEGTELSIGYYQEASLKLPGTPAAPIVLRGVRDEKDSWDGVRLYENTRDAELTSVQLVNVSAPAGVKVQGRGRAKLNKVSCQGCEATLTFDCESKVEQAATDGKVVAPTCR
jgi:hypothetical protein